MAVTRIVGIAVAVAIWLSTWPTAADDTKVTIDSITENNSIVGTVRGLTQAGLAGHVVVVYVKTNHWYIHPYASGGDGKSFATLDKSGKWTIETVRRTHAASEIAALVVKRDPRATDSPKVPAETENVQSIPNVGLTIEDLKKRGDYGKL